MVLVSSSYTLVYVVNKRRLLSLYGCQFLTFVMILSCSLWKILTGINRSSMYDSTYECILVGILPKYHISYNKYHNSTDTIVPEVPIGLAWEVNGYGVSGMILLEQWCQWNYGNYCTRYDTLVRFLLWYVCTWSHTLNNVWFLASGFCKEHGSIIT